MYATLDPAAIPAPLRSLKRWIGWHRVRTVGGRPTRRPDTSTRTGTWRMLEEAIARVKAPDANEEGVGLVMTGGVVLPGGYHAFALDLDGCRDPITGDVQRWAAQIVKEFSSYTEVTPSQTGLRIFGVSKKAVPALRVIKIASPVSAGDHLGCEAQLFGHGPAGYVSVTGWQVEGSPPHLSDGTAAFEWLTKTYPQAVAAPSEAEGELPVVVGREPTLRELDAHLRQQAGPHERPLIDRGDWRTLRLPSASEGWFALVRLALANCAGHIDRATEWLLECTAYGRGEVEDSKDPTRYQSETWVRADLLRLHAKRQSEVANVFSVLPLNGHPAAGEDQRSVFDRMLPEATPWDEGASEDAPTPGVATDDDENFFEDLVALVARDPRPQWLVQGLLERDCLVVVSGAPGTYKTFLALDVAFSLACGRMWHGRRVHAAPVLMLAGEGHGGLARRALAWMRFNEVAADEMRFAISRTAAAMLDDSSYGLVERDAMKKARAWGEAPGLIVIDTLNRNFGPGSENDTGDMSNFFARCTRLKARFPGATILVVHHTGHDNKDRSRGSSVIAGTADAEIVVIRGHDKKTNRPDLGAQVTFRKMKDAEEPAPLWITPEYVELGHDEYGDPYGSLVIDRLLDEEPNSVGERLSDKDVQTNMDKLLAAYQIKPQASRQELCEMTEMRVSEVRSTRDMALKFGLICRIGHTSAQRHELTTNGIDRLAGLRSDDLGPLQPDEFDGLDPDDQLALLMGE